MRRAEPNKQDITRQASFCTQEKSACAKRTDSSAYKGFPGTSTKKRGCARDEEASATCASLWSSCSYLASLTQGQAQDESNLVQQARGKGTALGQRGHQKRVTADINTRRSENVQPLLVQAASCSGCHSTHLCSRLFHHTLEHISQKQLYRPTVSPGFTKILFILIEVCIYIYKCVSIIYIYVYT